MMWHAPTHIRAISAISFLLSILTNVYGQNPDCAVFQVIEKGKFGCIDSKGTVVIEPRYIALQDFSEELAAARISGTYGYINRNGAFVISPQFDYANPFSEGLALAFIQGKPLFINTRGEKPFHLPYPYADSFSHGLAEVRSVTGKSGFINKKGKLVIDTAFRNVEKFISGTCVVTGLSHRPHPDDGEEVKLEIGVIDSLGKFIIPYGKYEDIQSLHNGHFMVEIPAEKSDTLGYSARTGFANKKGELVFSRDHKERNWISGQLCDGLAKMMLHKTPYDENIVSSESIYEGFVNLKGEIVVNDTNYNYVNNYSEERAFVRLKDDNYVVIDTHGKLITEERFSDVVGVGFENGLAIVQQNGKYGWIDCNGKFIMPPTFLGLERVQGDSGHFFFYNDGFDKEFSRVYGIVRTDGVILFEAIMDGYDQAGFQNGLLRCFINNKPTYLNEQGQVVWQGSLSKPKSNLNIDYLNRGHFYAYSKPNKKDLGGYGRSSNYPSKISKENKFPAKSLSITVQPELTDTIPGGYNGITVYVANTRRKKIDFNAQDSRLYMVVEAKNTMGVWQEIEYLPSSWCGNSYHTVTLDAGYSWKFVTPIYEGDYHTSLRIKLDYIDPRDRSKSRRSRKEITVYSNEFDGNVNPGQFWRRPEYYPSGIMDPYNN